MLYEVITERVDDLERIPGQRRTEAAADLVGRRGRGIAGDDREGLRITSYNVCYTKLLRYAAGIKSEAFDSRLQLNLEGFFYNYQDMQLVVLGGTVVRTENADTRMYGWDLEARAMPIEGLDLSAVLSFLDTELLTYA